MPATAAIRRILARFVLPCVAGLITAPSASAAATAPTLEDCHGIKDMAFVAHLDDDLLFMNPDIASNIEAGGCVRVVYLTASDAGEGDGYMLGREKGVRAAYAYMAHQPDLWSTDTLQANGHAITRVTLQGNPRVQLVHMRLKDPWLGKGWGSLTPLSRTESDPQVTSDTLGPNPETYTRDALVKTLAALIRDYGPTTVRHLDDQTPVPYTQLCWRCTGHSHPDHIASARLTREAMALVPGNYAEAGYVDYPSQERAANLSDAETTLKSEIFRRYAWEDYKYCKGPQGCQEPAGPAAAWVQRSYYVSRQDFAPELYSDARHGLLVFAAGEANDAVNLWDARQGRWTSLGGRTAGSLVSFAYPDATAGVFARDTLGSLWVNKQNLDGSWKGWQAMPGVRFSNSPVVAPRDAAAVAMGYDGRYYWTSPSGIGGGWNAWQPLPLLADAMGRPAIAMNAAGRFVVFAIDRAGNAWSTTQHAAGHEGGWAAWQPVPVAASAGGLAAMRNAQGLVELYLRDRGNRHLMRVVEEKPATARATAIHWTAAEDLGVEYVGKPAIGPDTQGNVLVSVLERAGGPLWLVERGRATLLEATASSLPAMRMVDGTLYVVARSSGNPQTYRMLARRGGVWGPATSLATLPAGGGGAFGKTIPTVIATTAPPVADAPQGR
ncbi:lipoprotein [Bordetella ansorpii]|uniref:Lipoprotein n=1 Tax=Bordetella ansorpii TaxID=288768 RepID=A0A146AJN1_9BORD|nr:PIG-L family deacetylase [Bordetella ansorpii]CZZ88582.1 lipoprotein [Bordetella ansorpii]